MVIEKSDIILFLLSIVACTTQHIFRQMLCAGENSQLQIRNCGEKALLGEYVYLDLLRTFGRSFKYIGQNSCVCGVRALNDDFSKISDPRSIHHRGYISTKVTTVHSRVF